MYAQPLFSNFDVQYIKSSQGSPSFILYCLFNFNVQYQRAPKLRPIIILYCLFNYGVHA